MSTEPPQGGHAGAPGGRSPIRQGRVGGAGGSILLIILLVGVAWLVLRRQDRDVPDVENSQHALIILIDTTRRDSFGCYGAERPVTPRMDEIAADGVRFDNAIAQSCWTLPTVTTVLTGTYASIHGAEGKFSKNNATSFHRSRDSIPHGPELLREHGFKTHGIVNAGFLNPALGIERGFMIYDYFPSYNWRVRRADVSVNAALKFYEQNRRKNTFTFLHLFDPHLNYDPPGEFRERFAEGYTGPFRTITSAQIQQLIGDKWVPKPEDQRYLRAEYDAEIAFMDREIGRLADGLRALGLYDDMLLIIVADHGEEFWDHGAFEHGHTMYEELIRVPLIVKLPARYEPRRRVVPERVRQMDVMPTVFDTLGLEAPKTFDGISLLPFMLGDAPLEDLPAYSEGTLYGVDKVAYYEGPYKYISDLGGAGDELYDVSADPLEKQNLLTAEPQAAALMRASMNDFRDRLAARVADLDPAKGIDMRAEQNEQLKDQLEALGYLNR